MTRRVITFGVIGCGLMGRELASAAGRWRHLLDLDFEPRIVAACDINPAAVAWFEQNVPELQLATADYRELLDSPLVEAEYVAVPHNQHQEIYVNALQAGKHLLGEKPSGIDLPANQAILQAASEHPDRLISCTSQFPFFSGAYRMAEWGRNSAQSPVRLV